MRHHYVLIVILLFSSFCFCQNSDPLNFQFQSKTDFRWNPEQLIMRTFSVVCDSIELINGKYPLHIYKPRLGLGVDPLKIMLDQTILLSDSSGGRLDLTIHNRTRRLRNAVVIVRTYNEQEQRLKEDSVSILTAEKWKWSKLMLPTHSFRFIRIIIKASGIAVSSEYQDDYQSLYLDRMTLLVNGKSINQASRLQKNVAKTPLILNPKNVYPLNDTMRLAIAPFQNSKIIGLGETMHQNGAIQDVVFDIFKRQIEYNRCRLILLECSIEYSLNLNWYVSGKAPDDFLDIIRQDLGFTLGDGFFDFIQWLRNYNRVHSQQQVRLLGMDVCSLLRESIVTYATSKNISRTLLEAIKREPVPDLSDFIRNVITNNYKDALTEMPVRRIALTNLLGEDNFEILQEILRQMYEVIPMEREMNEPLMFDLNTHRDYRMFLNYEKFSSMFLKCDESAVLYAHIGHLARNQTLRNESLGFYLSKQYSTAYSPIGIVVGTGSAIMAQSVNISTVPKSPKPYYIYRLQPPVPNSLEASAMTIPYNKYFYPLSADKNSTTKLGMMKIISNLHREGSKFEQFLPVSYNSWMDGFIFIRESEPSYDPQKINFMEERIKENIVIRDAIFKFMGVKPRE